MVCRVGYLEHEIENWIRARVRVGSGEPVAPPVPMPPADQLRIIAVKEVVRRVGFSRVYLWRLEQQKRFPARIQLNPPTPTMRRLAPPPNAVAAAE